jgi:hypothetical protein
MSDTAKIRVKRTITDPDAIVSAFSYADGDSTTTFVADPAKSEFDMTPVQAAAAVETGGFAVAESSKSKAKADTQPLAPKE